MSWLFVISFVLGVLTLFVLYSFEIKDFNRTGAVKFKFYTRIPFELNRFKRDRKDSYVFPALQVVGSLLLIMPMLAFALDVQRLGGAITVAYTLFTIVTLAFATFNILTFIKLSNYKLHMIFTTIFVGLVLLLQTLFIFFFSSSNYMYGKGILSQGVQIANFVVSLIFIIIEFALMLNPQYKNWFRMVKVDAETYNRPKYCYLAILERGTLVNLILSYIPVAIVMFA